MMEINEIACDMNPLIKPWIRAGIRHIKIMISSKFIFIPKNVYICGLKNPELYVRHAKIDKYFHKYGI